MLFDLDGTLYDLRRMRRRLIWRVPNEVLNHGPVGFAKRVLGLQRFRKARERHRGSPLVESLRDHLVGNIAKPGSATRLQGALDDFLYRSHYKELRGLSPAGDRQLLESLAARGYLLGVVSEYPVVGKLRALGLGTVPWRAQVSCEEVGTLKPQPEVFLEGARRLGVDPKQVLFVGDRLDADVTGAARVGMKTAWFKSRDPGYGGGTAPTVVIRGLGDLAGLLPARPARPR